MILLSGGFDPLHTGHIGMIEAASGYGKVVIALNSNEWLIGKKGFFFQSWEDRADILGAIASVFSVVSVDDSDGTVCEALSRLKPKYFGNGGDRTKKNTPELKLCKELDTMPIFGLGGEKSRASSTIAAKAIVSRKWGHYVLLDEGPGYKVKRLVIDPGKSTSRQRHEHRKEYWINPDMGAKEVPAGEWHQLDNPTEHPLVVIEVQTGLCEESDIERV